MCYEEHSSLEGIRCSNQHFTCNDCFGSWVDSVCDDALSKGNLDVKCVECDFVFENHDVCRHLHDAKTYEKFDEAGKALRVQKAREEERQRQEEESQRRLKMSEEERKINDARKAITEDILTLKCPRCKAAFVDFDGCFALSCAACPCKFCAGCLQDCGNDAHAHVSICRVCHSSGLMHGGGYYGSFELFEKIHKTRCGQRVREFLERPDMREIAEKVVEASRKELEGHKMHDVIARYSGYAMWTLNLIEFD